MTELTGWRRLIGHPGTFLAALELWPPARAGKVRALQSGYRALWRLTDAKEPAFQMGPIDVVGARSLAPGSTGHVLIHPLLPEAWRTIGTGARLTLVSRRQHPRAIGEATVLERRDVPASAPLNLEPFVETAARARLVAAAGPTAAVPSPETPPTVTLGTVTLPLLSAYWRGATASRETVPRSRTEEVELATSLPSPDVDRDHPVRITVTGPEFPASGEIAYFSGIDADGVPAGERRDVRWDSQTLLRGVEQHADGRWSVRIPAPRDARVVVLMLNYPPGRPDAPGNHAAWGFRLR